VPYSLGGTGRFGTQDVSTKANSDVGTLADGLLVNHPLITMERWRLQLKSQKGTVPGIEFNGTIDVNGSTVEASYLIQPDGSVELRVHPRVESDWTNRTFSVMCDPKDLPGILNDLADKSKKKGLPFSTRNIRTALGSRTTIERPTMSSEMSIRLFDLAPGFAKMALATGHFVFGEAWSRFRDADLLRAVINERDSVKRNAIPVHGQVWPNTPQNDALAKSCFIDHDTHVIVVLNQKPVAFSALLFGRFSGFIQLADKPVDSNRLPPGKGMVYVLCCKTRRLVSFDWDEFVLKQMTEKGQLY
jgi:hypothetical protein